MNNEVCFLSHPYHRGGVTQWMANAFNSWNRIRSNAYFVSVIPKVEFISGGGRPSIVSLLDVDFSKNVFTVTVGFAFELGTLSYRAATYRSLILSNIPPGVPIIPSDDEACWMAGASLVRRNPFFSVIHSYGDKTYYDLLGRYKESIHGIISVSKRIAALLNDKFGFESLANLKILPCGVPVTLGMDNLPTKKRRIVWVGRMEETSKRVSDIPKIIKRLDGALDDVEFHIIGDGAMFYFLDQFKKTFSGSNRIVLHGWRNQVVIREILESSLLLLQTSNYEGMSLSVMEALACGCCIVSSRVSGVEDYENNAETSGIINLFNIGDVDVAAKKIKNIFDHYDPSISQRALKTAFVYFDIDKTNDELASFISGTGNENRNLLEVKIPLPLILISPILSLMRYLKLNILKEFIGRTKEAIYF